MSIWNLFQDDPNVDTTVTQKDPNTGASITVKSPEGSDMGGSKIYVGSDGITYKVEQGQLMHPNGGAAPGKITYEWISQGKPSQPGNVPGQQMQQAQQPAATAQAPATDYQGASIQEWTDHLTRGQSNDIRYDVISVLNDPTAPQQLKELAAREAAKRYKGGLDITTNQIVKNILGDQAPVTSTDYAERMIDNPQLPPEYEGKEQFRVVPGSPQDRQLAEHPAYDRRELSGGQVVEYTANPRKAIEISRQVHDVNIQTDPDYVVDQYRQGNIGWEEAASRYSALTGVSPLRARAEIGQKSGQDIIHPVADSNAPLYDLGADPRRMPNPQGFVGQSITPVDAVQEKGQVIKGQYQAGQMSPTDAIQQYVELTGVSPLRARAELGITAEEAGVLGTGQARTYDMSAQPDSVRGRSYPGQSIPGGGDAAIAESIIGITHGEGGVGSQGTDINLPGIVREGQVVQLITENFRFSGPRNQPPGQAPNKYKVGVRATNTQTGEVWEAQ